MSIDRIPVPSGDGSLWLCGLRDVGDDPKSVLAFADRATTLVCLNQVGELESRFPTYLEWLRQNRGGLALWYPIENFSAPSASTMLPFLRMIVDRIDAGKGVVMHCAAGQGRAGTMAVCVLVMLGASLDEALNTVAENRLFAGPGEPSQRALVLGVADSVAS